MKIKKNIGSSRVLISSLLITMLAACGHKEDSSSPDTVPPDVIVPTATTVSGTAATGAPVLGEVIAFDKNFKTFVTKTNNDGTFNLELKDGTAPFMLFVSGSSNGQPAVLASFVKTKGGTANITSITDFITALVGGVPAANLLLEQCKTAQPNCDKFLQGLIEGPRADVVRKLVQQALVAVNPNNYDPMTVNFRADGTGMDAVLDSVNVSYSPPVDNNLWIASIKPRNVAGGVPVVFVTAELSEDTDRDVNSSVTISNTDPATVKNEINVATEALEQMKVCLASLNALYPVGMTSAPSPAEINPFIDATFMNNGVNKENYVRALTQLTTFGGGLARPNLFAANLSYSSMNFNPSSSGAINPASAPLNLQAPVPYAWVSLGNNRNWKFVKGQDYSGCPGGWKIAGDQHTIEMKMESSVLRTSSGPSNPATYSHSLSIHALPEYSVGSIVISGSGLAVYSGSPVSPVGQAKPITLFDVGNGRNYVMRGQVDDDGVLVPRGFYGARDAITSCQDFPAIVPTVPTGTPCYDETKITPTGLGKAMFTWTLYTNRDATGAVAAVVPIQVDAVPLPASFLTQHDKDLFPQEITTPTLSAINQLIAESGQIIRDNAIFYNYKTSSLFNPISGNCALDFGEGWNMQQSQDMTLSACSFTKDGLVSGSLVKGAYQVTKGTYSITIQAVGNNLISKGNLPS
ncbi:MAG: hypothetical protein K0R08_237 [Solimicrobium sp.]|jgi:hypothetical protein|nr:hypothetical protein [Solimicrobium sp.]